MMELWPIVWAWSEGSTNSWLTATAEKQVQRYGLTVGIKG